MKIVGIASNSPPGCVAFTTNSLISPHVAWNFREAYFRRPEFAEIEVEPHSMGVLVRTCHVPPGFHKFLEQCLNEAERFVQHEQAIERQKTQLAAGEQAETLEKLSHDLDLPLVQTAFFAERSKNSS
jgi:hypothetical protein